MFETYLAPGFPDPRSRPKPENRQNPHPVADKYRCTGHTWPWKSPDDPPGSTWRTPLDTTDEPDILGSGMPRHLNGPVVLYITMNRTYLAFWTAFSGRSTLAILETYDACVHPDVPDIFGACTHDVPDILLPMNRTYLGRALTMNRTYHYR
jgi:hypothetical protein